MFQMLNEQSKQPQDRKTSLVRAGVITLALVIVVAAIYIFAFLPYANR